VLVGHERSIEHSVQVPWVCLVLGRVPLAMEMEEALNPAEVRLLCARGVVFDADEVADAIEQKHRRNVPDQTGLLRPRIANPGHDFQGLCYRFPSVVWPILRDNSVTSAPFLPGAFASHISLGREPERALECWREN